MLITRNLSISFLLLISMAGCSTPIKSTGPYKPDDTTIREGQRYYVGKDIINISADVTNKIVPKVNSDLSIDAIEYTNSVVNVTKTLVPDYRQYYLLQVKPGGVYEDKITITTTPDGMLKTLSTEVTGKASEVIKDIGSIAANLLAISPVVKSAALTLDERPCVDAAISIGLNLEHQLFARESKEGCRLIKRLDALKEVNQALVISIDELRSNMASESDEEKLNKIKNKLVVKSGELKNVANELSSLNATYGALFTLFKDRKLSTKTKQFTLKQSYEITELPNDKELNVLIGKSKSDVTQYLRDNRYTKMEELFEESKVILSRSILSPLTEEKFSKDFPSLPKGEEMPTNRIHFRQTYPFHIGEYKMEYTSGKSNPPTFEKSSTSIISLAHPYSPIQYIEYNPSSFSKRKLDLTFDIGSGVLTSIVTDNGSSAQGVSSAISGTLKSMQAEYVAALGNIDSAQTKLNKIRLNDYQKDIDEYEKKKELIDARVEFEGAEASQELLIEQKLLAQKLNTLNAELALAKAESTYEQNLGLAKLTADLNLLSKQLDHAKTEITYEQKLEIEKLKTEILLLQEKVKLSEQSK